MIPRYQKIVFFALLVLSIAMTAVLVRLRERAHDRLLKGEDVAPTSAPAVAPAEQATLVVANDTDGTLVPEAVSLPLPKDEGARARALLEKLLEIYASPDSSHPVPATPRPVGQVFLLALSDVKPDAAGKNAHTAAASPDQGQMAVVNLAGSFADGHPSGIEVETLTVLSICATLHANLPQITQVRFLVDGAERKTLAGHADLSRIYLATEAVAGAAASSAPTDATGAKP
jgi:hypothetical protein